MRRPLTDALDVRLYAREETSSERAGGETMPLGVAALIVFWLAAITVFAQEHALGLRYIEQTQLTRHHAVLSGSAPDPWAYRLFSEWVVAIVLRIAHAFDLARPAATGFLTLRFLQNIAIFSLALTYYRRLGVTPQLQAIGVVLLAWSMSHALYNSDLSVNTYFDLIAYLIAAVCVASDRIWMLVPLALVAAFNRDTGAMIPLLAVAPLIAHVVHSPRSGLNQVLDLKARRPIMVAIAGVVAFGTAYWGIRHFVGPAPWPWGNAGGSTMLRWNLHDPNVYLYVPLTFSALPIVAVWRWRQLPALLRGLLLLLGPPWATTLFALVYVAESRLFLVPIAVAFIPSALVATIAVPHSNANITHRASGVHPSPDHEQRTAERHGQSAKQPFL